MYCLDTTVNTRSQIPVDLSSAQIRRQHTHQPSPTCADTHLSIVRITLTLDDDLIATAERYTGLKEKSALVHEALRALIERESASRLGRLGGSEPDLKPVARRKTSA